MNYNYKPLPPTVDIKDSDIHGRGIIAILTLPKGYRVGLSHVVSEGLGLPNDLIRTPLGGFLNHSPDPNCKLEDTGGVYYLVTLYPISIGEELTVNYDNCPCGVIDHDFK